MIKPTKINNTMNTSSFSAKIAVKELSKSRLKETFICVTDEILSNIYRATISDLKM